MDVLDGMCIVYFIKDLKRLVIGLNLGFLYEKVLKF